MLMKELKKAVGKITAKINKSNLSKLILTGAIAVSTITAGFAAPVSIDLNSMVSKIMLLFFGIMEVYGLVDLATGSASWFGATHDEGGGQDVAAANKGKAKAFKGGFILALPWAITFLTGIDPFHITFF